MAKRPVNIHGRLDKILPSVHPKAVSLELSVARPKSRRHFMRVCGRMWDRMGEEGLATKFFTLRLTDTEPNGSLTD